MELTEPIQKKVAGYLNKPFKSCGKKYQIEFSEKEPNPANVDHYIIAVWDGELKFYDFAANVEGIDQHGIQWYAVFLGVSIRGTLLFDPIKFV